MKLNMRLLPIKAHYFLLFAGTAPMLPFLPVYIRQQGISAAGISLIYTVLPFVGLLVKALSGILADWFRVHRAVFLSSVAVCGVGFFSIYFCPPMPQQSSSRPALLTLGCDGGGGGVTYCSPHQRCAQAEYLAGMTEEHLVACTMICETTTSPPPPKSEERRERETPKQEKSANSSSSSSSGSSSGSGSGGDLCTELGVSPCRGVAVNISAVSDVGTYSRVRHCTTFPLANVSLQGVVLPNLTCATTTTAQCKVTCSDPALMTFLGAPPTTPPATYQEVLTHSQFWLHLLCMVVAWSGLAVTVVMSDTICFQLLGADGDKYGEQRLFGSVGWGALVVVTGALIDYASEGHATKDYTPAFILALAILLLDLMAATRLQVEAGEKGGVSVTAGVVARLVCEPRVVLFIVCCVVVGISTGILWTYQLMLVEDIAFAWDCHFSRLKLLQGLVMGVQCFGGELPFFFLSGTFIRKLGHAGAMSLVTGVFGLRYILYYVVSNPWWFLPVELLNGFTFGIFYATMTSYASQVAPPGYQATLQGIVGASFEGIGVATGGFVGGALFFTVGGSRTFLYTGIFNLLFTVIHITLHLLLNHCSPHTALPGGGGSPGGYVPPSDSLRPVAATEEDTEEGM